MGKKEFDDFLKKEDGNNKKNINWEENLRRWKKNVDLLYSNIEYWLKEYTDNGRVFIDKKDKEVFEEAIGKYTIPKMNIKLGNKLVVLEPIGTVLIGTIGRVDVIGEKKTQKLILADKDSTGPKIEVSMFTSEEDRKRHDDKIKKLASTPVNWVWKLTTNPPDIVYSELNEGSFFECLMDVSNG
ncbi:MAG: hypothetical protein R2799_16595 [Crocinitomicaceae bacterium]